MSHEQRKTDASFVLLPYLDRLSLSPLLPSHCAQRTAKDYAYVSANDEHRGPSDPGSYSVSCKHERMVALMRTGLERYNAEMARVAVERERQAKDAALQVSRGPDYARASRSSECWIPANDCRESSVAECGRRGRRAAY